MKTSPEEAFANDNKLREKYGDVLCGIDEVGRGSWAGPLVVGAVILPKDICIPKLTDSKLLSQQLRTELAEQIKAIAIAWEICQIEPNAIDRKGLTWANAHASYTAGIAVSEKNAVDLFVIDQMPACDLEPHIMMAKADSLSHVVAAASVIAKDYRDRLMQDLEEQYPEYHLGAHKGYISATHKDAVEKYGRVRGLHRFSYKVGGVNTDMGRTDLLKRKL